MIIAATIFSLFLLLALGLPIAVSLFISGLTGYVLSSGFQIAIQQLPQTVYSSLYSFVIAAIPLYILMGQIMLKGGMGRDLFNLVDRLVGRIPGGMVVASIVACAIFAAISGSSTATVATIGGIALPEMLRRGYDRKQAAGALAIAGSLGILIPPSTQFILYSVTTDTSVGKLFTAGILPGVMLAALFAVYTFGYEVYRARGIRAAFRVHEHSTASFDWNVVGGILIIPLVLGGIYTGIFTPTEAAGIGVAYALIYTVFIRRSLTIRTLWEAVRDSVVSGAMIMMLIAASSVFGNALGYLQVPQEFASLIENFHLQAWQFLVFANILFLILGAFMDSSAAILTTMPVLVPALQLLGIDPIWFGVILIINMEIGAVTPPVGMNLFVIQALRRDYKTSEVLKGALPYVLVALIGMVLVMVFPEIALWLTHSVK